MNWKWLSVAGLILGMGFFILAAYSYVINFEFLTHSDKVYGRVIGIDNFYNPEIKFTVKTGQSATFISLANEGNSGLFAYKNGDMVVVEYDPTDLTHADLASTFTFNKLWLKAIIFFSLGIFMFIASIGCKIILDRQKPKAI